MTDRMNLEVLKNAALRCDGYLTQYGVIVTWSLYPLGLRVVGECGADRVERTIDWWKLETTDGKDVALQRLEQAVLKGLSD